MIAKVLVVGDKEGGKLILRGGKKSVSQTDSEGRIRSNFRVPTCTTGKAGISCFFIFTV